MPDIAFRHTGLVGELPYRTGFTANESLVPIVRTSERFQERCTWWRGASVALVPGDELRFAAATLQSNPNASFNGVRCIRARRVNVQDIRERCSADADAYIVLTGRHLLDERTQGGAVTGEGIVRLTGSDSRANNRGLSGCKLTPPGQGGGAIEFEVLAIVKMTFLVEMIVDGGVNGSKLLQGLDVSEPGHRAFSSAEWLV